MNRWVFLGVGLFLVGRLSMVEGASDPVRERLVYDVNPMGRAEYEEGGFVREDGVLRRKVIFHTRTVGLDDVETILEDAVSGLPVSVTRDVKLLFGNEHLVETYDQVRHILVVKKFNKKRLIKTYEFKADGPIHNSVLLPFTLRGVKDLKVGWSATFWFPLKFKVSLTAIETIRVPAGSFEAYHFTSEPHKFDVWISTDARRLPLKIRGSAGVSATLVLKRIEYIPVAASS